MKTLLLLFFVTSVNAQVDLEDATRQIAGINETVAQATTPAASCSHGSDHHHTRKRLVVDESVPVELCPPNKGASREPAANIEKLIKDYKISFVPANERDTIIASEDFHLFVQEFRKFPPALLQQMARAGSKITLIRGNGVADDPAWDQERLAQIERVERSRRSREEKDRVIAEINRGYSKTVDGNRDWAYTSGAGGNFSNRNHNVPTRIVINHMYSTDVPLPGGGVETRPEGSVNLFLHEHAHALDNFYGPGTISNSTEWKNIRELPEVAEYLKRIFTDYEFNQLNEGFAEAFAYYYGCPASQAQMKEKAPKLAEFLEKLATRQMREFR